MLTENTINKFQEMRLSTMANAFREQLSDPNISELSFEDRFGLLVDKEWATRKSNHLTKLIKKANFADTGACVENITYDCICRPQNRSCTDLKPQSAAL